MNLLNEHPRVSRLLSPEKPMVQIATKTPEKQVSLPPEAAAVTQIHTLPMALTHWRQGRHSLPFSSLCPRRRPPEEVASEGET